VQPLKQYSSIEESSRDIVEPQHRAGSPIVQKSALFDIANRIR